MGFFFRASPQDFKTCMLGRGFHNVSFLSITNVGSRKANMCIYIYIYKRIIFKERTKNGNWPKKQGFGGV